MKKSIIILALVAGTTFTACKNNAEKEAEAVEEVQDANADLNSVKEEANADMVVKANDAEWQAYKIESNRTIDQNETRITELQMAMKKPGKTFDEAYKNSIDDLQEKNMKLRTKIVDYENNQTDWASFKREFESDMTELGNAMNDLTVNNKK